MSGDSLEQVFTGYYEGNAWGSKRSRSGPGSTPEAAAPYVQFVKEVITTEGIRSVVDWGHGDWAMWPKQAFDGVHYWGIDVVKGLSARLADSVGDAETQFVEGNFLKVETPPADLLLCKEVLVHLSDSDIKEALQRAGRYPFAIFCHSVGSNPSPSGRVLHALHLLRSKVSVRSRWRRSVSRWLTDTAVPAIPEPSKNSGGFRPIDLEDPFWNLRGRGMFVKATRDFVPSGQRRALFRIWLIVGDAA